MKNLKTHHHLAIVSILVFGVIGIWSWGTLVFAGSSGSTIKAWVGPPDVCLNVSGHQNEVPEGMFVDGDGNCYTPPPTPVDMCENISGTQETIPEGYYRNAANNCLPQPTPPTPPNDVCPNLPGLQAEVPDGYENAENGFCIKPAADMCNNITGVQKLVPDAMERAENGDCFTPDPEEIAAPVTPPKEPQNPWVAPVEPRAPVIIGSRVDLKNIPATFDPVIAPFVNAIPETVKEALRSVPPVIAQTFPYFTLAVLAAAATIMTAQTANEVRATKKIATLIKREKDIADEKDSFIALASHYLRTPLTIMEGALDTSRAVNELTDEDMAPLRSELLVLDNDITSILADVEANTALKNIKAPNKKPTTGKFLTSAFFWVPILATIVIVWVSNFLLGVVGDVELGTFNLLAQGAIYVATSALFYSAIRTRYIQRNERAYREKLLKHEEVIDRARNEFIARSTLILANSLGAIAKHRGILEDKKSEPYFTDGYDRFMHLLQKFNLLSEIQAGVVSAAEKFDLKSAIDEIVKIYEPKLQEKNLTIINNITPSDIKQRRSLFTFVFGSLIDNAIKFSNDGGTITIGSKQNENSLTVSITDYGLEIPEDKMSLLFKPFSRGTSTMEFNYEGLGFSLFLDKIIMDYVGGQINASSIRDKNTTFSVTTPTA
jgi:signal transduction histidine kinase